MQRLQAFKFELRPDSEQVRQMRRFSGNCRSVFNKALETHLAEYEDNKTPFDYTRLANRLPEWKQDRPWLKDSPSQTLQQSIKDLERAFRNFFAGRAALPRFKRKGMGGGFRYPDPQQIRLEQGTRRIFLPKLGWIRYRASRTIPGIIKNVTVSCTGDHWFVSVQTEREVDLPVPPQARWLVLMLASPALLPAPMDVSWLSPTVSGNTRFAFDVINAPSAGK